jgi:hypothetical protein
MRATGQRTGMLDEARYERLPRKAGKWQPDSPATHAGGNYPALVALAVLPARNMLRAGRSSGPSQAKLARSAGIRSDILNRIEPDKNKPSVLASANGDRALTAAEGKRKST